MRIVQRGKYLVFLKAFAEKTNQKILSLNRMLKKYRYSASNGHPGGNMSI
jgi:hypothetical protein